MYTSTAGQIIPRGSYMAYEYLDGRVDYILEVAVLLMHTSMAGQTIPSR